MLKYEDLKKSPDGMPTWDSLIPVVMAFAVQEGSWKGREFRQKVADHINLPDNLRYKTYENGSGIVIEDRAGWAMSRLRVAGLLHIPRRGFGEVTDLGRQLYEKHGDKLDDNIARQQKGFIERHQMLQERKNNNESVDQAPIYDDAESFEEVMSALETHHKDEVATQLLERIYNESPVFFEHLAVKLLEAMGYKGTGSLAKVTSPTRDGGIDGVINQDPLGIGRVYIQAKRYQRANKVGRPDIDAFYGALRRERADRGVFITSSGFSKDAEEAAKDFSIVTINGIQLTNFMLQYGVGVRVERTYHLYDIDEEFFELD
ncbi:MAG: restriction endonuclease [Defluviitaleaceae bacterium]|nr:restriction endonuclease [Defluviitaleaceae bacterium]